MEESIVLYDSKCQFCNKWVYFVKTKLKKRAISFIALNSSEAIKILEDLEIENEDSVVYIKGDAFYLKSKAVLKICSQLKFPYKLIQSLTILPAFLLDIAYDFIAKRRFKLTNKKQCCNG